MKKLCVLFALLLVAPAAAQSDGQGDCRDEPCERGPPEDRPQSASSTAPPREPRGDDDRAARFCAQNPEAGHCRTDDGSGLQELKHIAFFVDRRSMAIEELAIDGRYVADLIQVRISDNGTLVTPDPATVSFEKRGNQILFLGDGWRLRLMDNPGGTIVFQGDAFLHINTDAELERSRNLIRFDYGDYRGVLTGEDLADDGPIFAYGDAKFSLEPRRGNDVSDRVHAAIEARKLGGEVHVRGAATDVYAYDEVNVTVEAPERITAESPLRVVFDGDLEAGRTFVVDVDPNLLDGPELDLRYSDVHDDGTETEVVFRMAADLTDILDPDDDGGQPEYWVVRDADGIQLMVSVPHWSVHAITVSSFGAFVTQPSVLLGIGAGVVGVGVAALLMLRPRKDPF